MVLCYLDAKEPVYRAEVGQCVAVVELLLELFDKLQGAASDDAVIHMGCEDEDMLPLVSYKHPGVCTADTETNVS